MSTQPGFELRFGHATAVGSKPINEDSFAIRVPEPALEDTKGAVALIADGLSGSQSGREAAQLAVHGFLSDYFSTPETWSVNTAVSRVLAALNGWLFRAESDRETTRATTMTILILKSRTAHIFHMGDTRILRVRAGQPDVLTQAHRIVMPSGEAYLSRAVGIEPLLQVDYRREPLELGDYFVLSTDGVHDALSDHDIVARVAAHAGDPKAAAAAIVAAAQAADPSDNATCVTVEIAGLPGEKLDEFYAKLTRLPFPPDLAPGMRVDGYRVVSELHASTRSQIYLVEDLGSGLELALKTPSVNFEDDPRYIHQFITEEWIGQRLHDPRIVRILEPPRARSFLYTLMEPIAGTSLRQWMDDHPKPPVEQAQRIASELASALTALHRLEVLHRDLKPQNVMLGDDGTIKLIDLGSVRIAALDEIVTPLDPNHLVGTLEYAAPEFYENQPGSERSDLYALGTIVYEILTGELPYRAHRPTKTDDRHAHYVSALHENPMVPTWIDGALQKSVACNPEARYEALSEFVYDLTHPNPKFVYRVPRPLIERDPVAFWRGVAGILLVIDIVALYWLLT